MMPITARVPMDPAAACIEVGLSDAANRMKRGIAESVEHYLGPRLDQLVPEIRATGADNATIAVAIQFASLLPRLLPVPETSLDPDGEVSFDWLGPSEKMFTVSVNKSGRLSYAGLFEMKNRLYGTESLGGSFPSAIFTGLLRATLDSRA